MSRRSGQGGTIVKQGRWYRVRFRVDVPGQYKRPHKSIKLCPVSGPGLMTKPERERRKVEIVNSFGANSEEQFNRVMAIERGEVFREQAKKWLDKCRTRKRKPVKSATMRGWESYLANHLNPSIGDIPLASVNNSTLKGLVAKLREADLGEKMIRNVVQTMTAVVASAVNEDGEAIYPRKWNYDFADVPIVGKQRTPSFSGEEITKIIAKADGQAQVVFLLFAASGLRAGELFGLEVKHLNGVSVTIAQSVWEGRVQTPKTSNAYRQVDLHPTVAAKLRGFIDDRREGFIFKTRTGTPFLQSNFLRSYLYPLLEELGIEKQGFHGFRRFRNTYLRNFTSCPDGLRNFWLGWSGKDMSDHYDRIREDAAFRRDVAEQIGLGFELPKVEKVEVVPNVPNSEEMEVAVSV